MSTQAQVAPAAAVAAHTITITVVSGKITLSDPSLVVNKNDTINWTYAGGSFALQFPGLSPTKQRKDKKNSSGTITMDVRSDVGPGVYKYAIAVASGSDVLLDDPEIIVDVV